MHKLNSNSICIIRIETWIHSTFVNIVWFEYLIFHDARGQKNSDMYESNSSLWNICKRLCYMWNICKRSCYMWNICKRSCYMASDSFDLLHFQINSEVGHFYIIKNMECLLKSCFSSLAAFLKRLVCVKGPRFNYQLPSLVRNTDPLLRGINL